MCIRDSQARDPLQEVQRHLRAGRPDGAPEGRELTDSVRFCGRERRVEAGAEEGHGDAVGFHPAGGPD
eukprot:12419554-Alexandrium_andersonii.AAC.1